MTPEDAQNCVALLDKEDVLAYTEAEDPWTVYLLSATFRFRKPISRVSLSWALNILTKTPLVALDYLYSLHDNPCLSYIMT